MGMSQWRPLLLCLAGVVGASTLTIGGIPTGTPSTVTAAALDATEPAVFARRPADEQAVDASAVLTRRIKSEPSSLNPILMFTGVDAEFDYLLWDRPFVIGRDVTLRLNPEVALSYEEAPDHLSATLTLRKNLHWHDGAPLTAEDVAFSWRMIMDPRTVCRAAGDGPDQLAACEAIEPHRVRYTFKHPRPTNRLHVNFPILPRHVYAPIAAEDPSLIGSSAAVRANRHPVGNGPYRLAEWADGQRLVLERWADYPGERPAWRRIVFEVIPDNNAALLALETGRLDDLDLTPQQFALETDGERFQTRCVKARTRGLTTYYVGWNTSGDNPLLRDARVRRALSHAINTPVIIDRVFHGLFLPSAGLFPQTGGRDVDAVYAYDLAEAARLLDAAGWRRNEDDGWRYHAGTQAAPQKAVFTLNLVQGSQTSPKIAAIWQQDLRKLGVEMAVRVLEWAVFNERNYAHAFDAYLSAWTPGLDPDDAWNLFHSDARTGGRNYVGYANPQVDALFERGRRTFDPNERRAIYSQIGQIIRQDAPYTYLVDAPVLWAFDRRLRGVELSPRGPSLFFPGVRAWWTPAEN